MSDSFKNYSLKKYCEDLSSSAPFPGGGGTAALVGALAASLGNMVGSLTVGKKTYADVEDEIKEAMVKCQEIRERFLSLIDDDAIAFEPLSKAYGLPKDYPGRDEIMEEALKEAASVPVIIIETCSDALDVIEIMAEKGSRLAVSDAGCAAALIKSTLESAQLNVYINTKYMKDRQVAEDLNDRISLLVREGSKRSEDIYSDVLGRIK